MSRLFAGVLALFVLCPGFSAEAQLQFSDCELTGSGGFSSVSAECATFIRPENPADSNGPTIELQIARIRSLSPNPKPDAFTVINGGPGASSITLYADSSAIFRGILRERDIIVIDQRGTGLSNPLDCPELEELGNGLSEGEFEQATDQCLEDLDSDPRYFTTSVAVTDLEALRLELGYAQLNLYGVSYGTRVAQHYVRRYQDAVRTLIIDGVVPSYLSLGPNAAINAQRTLDRLFARCANDDECSEAFPDLAAHFAQLQERLRADPTELEVAHPVTGKRQPFILEYAHLAVTLRMMSYAPETASVIPLMIEQAYRDSNYLPIATNAMRIITSLNNMMRFGMHNAVVCSEDLPYLDDVNWQELNQTYMGSEQVEALQAICDRWPVGQVDEDFKLTLTTDVPTLLLSGTEDPITPPVYADEVADGLPNSRHLVGAGQGHGVFARGCFPQLLAEFVESADLASLETDCVSRLDHQPFFVDMMGPAR